jgi:hypothetical protein
VDGSESSEQAYYQVKNELIRDCDRIVVGHVRNINKPVLSWHFKPDYISEIYESRLLEFGKKGEFAMVDVMQGKSTKEMLVALARERGASCIVTSMHGRKGPKE